MKKMLTFFAAALMSISIMAQADVIYNWSTVADEQVGTTTLGTTGMEISTVKIHTNNDAVPAIKFGNSYAYADGKWLAIKPAEGRFKAGDVLSIAVVFNNADDTKYCMADVYAADTETLLFRSDSSSTINGRTSAAEPVVQTYTLESDQDSLLLGRKGNTTMYITLLSVERGSAPAPAPKYYIVGNMTGWAVNAAYEMIPSNEYEGEFEYDITLTTESQFKVVKVEGEAQTWYPDGMGNNFGENGEIERGGDYTVYFRPTEDGGEGWFYSCIFVVRHPVAERVIVGALFPANGMPAAGVKVMGPFHDEEVDMEYVAETGWYVAYNVMAADEEMFHFRDAADDENFFMKRDGNDWVVAEFTFDEVWVQDSWKGEPVKMIELDMSDNSKYAWLNAIPEGVDNINADVKAAKVLRNGEVLILNNGKTFNLLGTEVK